MANELYYNLGEYIRGLLDVDALNNDLTPDLTDSECQVLGDILYKLMIIADGETAKDQFAYNTAQQERIARDPATVVGLLPDTMRKLAAAEMVPDTISEHGPEGVTYPNKIRFTEQSEAVQKALQLLAENPDRYVNTEVDPLSVIPVHPEGVILGDFSNVHKLTANSVDRMIGSRSLVYVRGEDWLKTGVKIAEVLKQDGIWIDDSIRDNDGYRYRVAEGLQMQAKIADPDVHIHVVLGPGFEREDYQQTGNVPLSLVMTKGASAMERVRAATDETHEIIPLDQLADRINYLESLTAAGEVANEVMDVQAKLEVS